MPPRALPSHKVVALSSDTVLALLKALNLVPPRALASPEADFLATHEAALAL